MPCACSAWWVYWVDFCARSLVDRCGAAPDRLAAPVEEDHLRPVAVDGLVSESLGRRFAVHQHPRLAAILARAARSPALTTTASCPTPTTACSTPWWASRCRCTTAWAWPAHGRPALGRAHAGRAADRHLRRRRPRHAGPLRRAWWRRPCASPGWSRRSTRWPRARQHLGEPADEQHLRAALDDRRSWARAKPCTRLLHEMQVVAGLRPAGAAAGRDRRGQGAVCAPAAPPLAAPPQAAGACELRGPARIAGRERAVRPPPRRVLGRRERPPGRFEAAEGGTCSWTKWASCP
jgi:anaerobic nitric oxide reductase transcription regulator